MKYMFQSLVQYMVYQPAISVEVSLFILIYDLEMVLFQFGSVLAAIVYRALQKLEIELTKFLISSMPNVSSFIS